MTGLLAAIASALCSGVANVLQARGAGRSGVAEPLVALVTRLVRSPSYLAGLLLVAAGSLLALVALRELPVFVVAVARATSLGVTALLAWPMLGVRVARRDWVALAALALGLVVVVTAAAQGPAAGTSIGTRRGLVVAVLVLGAAAALVARHRGRQAGVGLAVLAGLCFGLTGVAARTLTGNGVAELLRDPALWAIGAGGALGLLGYAAALQRSSVTAATAAVVGVETLVGAVVGLLLLGDATKPGWEAAGVVGFTLALGGAVALAGSEATRATHPPATG